MKRKGNLYKEICKIENITKAFEEVCRNTKNKRKVGKFKEFKCVYINQIYRTLNNREYKVGPYTVFKIYEPKERRIKKKLNKRFYMYSNNQISLNSIVSSINCYKSIDFKETSKFIKEKINPNY